jgi:peroxiredoxin
MNAQSVQEFGRRLPDFMLPEVGGGDHTLGALMEGKKGAVVVFWSGVCSHCVRYDSWLNRFRTHHQDLALAVVASRYSETRDQILKTMRDRGIRFPILHDADSSVARQWLAVNTPRAFLLDAGANLLYRGPIDNFKFPDDPEYVAYLEPAIADFYEGRPVGRREAPGFGCAIQSVYYILPRHL